MRIFILKNTKQTNRFQFTETDLKGLWIVDRKPLKDNRGFFSRFYCADEFSEILSDGKICQINQSVSNKMGTVRGLHYQIPPHSETKIVSCLKGRILDVAVDLRKKSPTYLKTFSIELSEANMRSLVIPKGFAHGFQTLEKNSEVIYLVTANYSHQHERGINPFDPELGINWPLEVQEISRQDQERPLLKNTDFHGI